MLESMFKLGLIFSATNNTSGVFGVISRDADKVREKIGSLSQRFFDFRTATGKLMNLPNAGLFVGGYSFLKLGMDMEQTRLSFKVMVGDVQEANKIFNDLNRFADVTPFSNDEVLKAGKSLMAFGVPLNDMQKVMMNIGNVASGLNIPFGELSEIYGKIRVQGKMYGDDIRQLQGRGIPIVANLAKVMGGKSTEAITQMVTEGKILSKNFEEAFANMSAEGSRFYNMMEEQSKTAAGKMSTAIGQFKYSMSQASESLMAVFSAFIDKASSMATGIGKFVAVYPQLTKAIAGTTLGLAGLYIGYRIFNVLRTGALVFASGVGSVITAVRTLRALQMAQNLTQYYTALEKAGRMAPIVEWLHKVARSTAIATAAQAAYNFVCNLNPYVRMITLEVALAGVIGGIAYSLNRATTAQQIYNDVKKTALEKTLDERAELEVLFRQLKATNVGSEKRNEIAKNMKDMYPDYLGKMDLEKATLEDLEKAYNQTSEAMQKKAEQEIIYEKMKEISKKKFEAQYDILEHSENRGGKHGYLKMFGAAANNIISAPISSLFLGEDGYNKNKDYELKSLEREFKNLEILKNQYSSNVQITNNVHVLSKLNEQDKKEVAHVINSSSQDVAKNISSRGHYAQ